MLCNKILSICTLVLLGTALAARPAHALVDVCNTATGNYNNSAAVVQAAVNGSTCFTAQSNPILSIVKTRNPGTGAPGTNVTFDIKVTYPKIVDVPLVCGDDSTATSVVITDPIPSGANGFTYVGGAGTLQLSTDNGGSFVNKSSASDADELSVVGSTLTANLANFVEGQGDAACTPATAVIIRVIVQKN